MVCLPYILELNPRKILISSSQHDSRLRVQPNPHGMELPRLPRWLASRDIRPSFLLLVNFRSSVILVLVLLETHTYIQSVHTYIPYMSIIHIDPFYCRSLHGAKIYQGYTGVLSGSEIGIQTYIDSCDILYIPRPSNRTKGERKKARCR
jgi:hypothetical protein